MKRITYFRPIEVLPVIIFLLGFALKTYHLPFAHVILLASGPMAFIILLLNNIFRKDKTFLPTKTMLALSNSAWLTYFSLRLLFLSGAPILFYTAIVLTVVTLVLSTYKKQLVVIQKLVLFVHVALGIFLMSYSTSKLYYSTVLGKSAKEYPEDYPYFVWDNYSWYLYDEQLYDDALDANVLAKISAKSAFKAGNMDSSIFYRLEDNKAKIENRNWKSNERF